MGSQKVKSLFTKRSLVRIYFALVFGCLISLSGILWYAYCFGLVEELLNGLEAVSNVQVGISEGTSAKLKNSEMQVKLYKDQSQVFNTLNSVFFTIKTTPKNYGIRIHTSNITWFQKVNRKMISLVSDYVNDTFKKEKEFERKLSKEGYQLVLTNFTIAHNTETLCSKTGIEFKLFYDYLDRQTNEADLPQWFCHLDDDVYINVKQFKKLLSNYNTSKPYFVGTHYCCAKGMYVKSPHIQQLQQKYHVKVKRRLFWHASGPTYCMSLPLMKELKQYICGSETYRSACEAVGYPDEFTVAAIIGVILGYNITHTKLIDYERISYTQTNFTQLSKMCTINYQGNKQNGYPVDRKFNHSMRLFDRKKDPVGLLSFHCLLYNETDWCPHKA